MISTIETRKVVKIEIERSELHNLLHGEVARCHAQVRAKADDIPVDVILQCSNPETQDDKVEEID